VKVLVVDDSVVFRTGISRALAGHGDVEVVGTASNGNIALQKISQLSPDLITLDLEMPEMDGLTVIREVRKTNRDLKIVVFSDQSEAGAKKTLEALASGANDFLSKSVVKGSGDSVDLIRQELLPKIRQFVVPVKVLAPASPRKELPVATALLQRPKLILIASSTGGPEALRRIFSELKGYEGPPMLLVQHMPPLFTAQLARMLSEYCGWPVREAKDLDVLRPNTAYLAPGDFHMVLKKTSAGYILGLTSGERVKSVRPAADVTFVSVAECFPDPVWTFVLTGMGDDGLDGAKALKAKGNKVFIQDQKTSVVWGMPGAIAKEGIHDQEFSLEQIAAFIMGRT